MGARKIRVQKSKGQKVEDVLTITERAREWMDSYSYWVAGALVGLLAIAILYWGVSSYTAYQERLAREAYAQMYEKWPQEDISNPEKWKEYVSGAEKFVKEHDGTRAGLSAQLDLAQAYYHMQRYDEALKLGEKTVGELAPGDELEPLARYQLALGYKAVGKADEAGARWQPVGNEELSGMSREVHWQLAMFYSQQQQYTKAVEHYEKALEAAGSYPQNSLLEMELASARVKAGAGAQATRKDS